MRLLNTDQFPSSYYETTMLTILKIGGFTSGRLNFDAHIRGKTLDVVRRSAGWTPRPLPASPRGVSETIPNH